MFYESNHLNKQWTYCSISNSSSLTVSYQAFSKVVTSEGFHYSLLPSFVASFLPYRENRKKLFELPILTIPSVTRSATLLPGILFCLAFGIMSDAILASTQSNNLTPTPGNQLACPLLATRKNAGLSHFCICLTFPTKKFLRHWPVFVRLSWLAHQLPSKTFRGWIICKISFAVPLYGDRAAVAKTHTIQHVHNNHAHHIVRHV